MIKKNFSYRPGVLEKTDPSDGKPIYFQVWQKKKKKELLKRKNRNKVNKKVKLYLSKQYINKLQLNFQWQEENKVSEALFTNTNL